MRLPRAEWGAGGGLRHGCATGGSWGKIQGMDFHLPIPSLPGLAPVVVHDCPSCRRPVRIAYRTTERALLPSDDDLYSIERSVPGYRLAFHTLGAVAIDETHAEPRDEWWGVRRLFEEGGCGWVVPEIDQHTSSLVERLILGRRDNLDLLVEGTPDPSRFFRSSLVRWASAHDADWPPLGLVALPLVARAILVDGADPQRLPPVSDLMGADHDRPRAIRAAHHYAALFGVTVRDASRAAA